MTRHRGERDAPAGRISLCRRLARLMSMSVWRVKRRRAVPCSPASIAWPSATIGGRLATRGLPEAPAIRAIAPHPEHPDTVYVGTQHGPYRSTDRGERWEKLDVPDHGLPVWSLQFDPHDARVMYAGYENCEIFRSEDGGDHWEQLPVTVRFPEVTVAPGANPAKRVLELAVNPGQSQRDLRRHRSGRRHPQPGRRRALGEHEPRPVPERRHGGHARRARRAVAAGHGARNRSCGPLHQHGPGRALGQRPARATEHEGPDLLPGHPRSPRAIPRPSGSRRAPTSRATSARCSAARTAA